MSLPTDVAAEAILACPTDGSTTTYLHPPTYPFILSARSCQLHNALSRLSKAGSNRLGGEVSTNLGAPGAARYIRTVISEMQKCQLTLDVHSLL